MFRNQGFIYTTSSRIKGLDPIDRRHRLNHALNKIGFKHLCEPIEEAGKDRTALLRQVKKVLSGKRIVDPLIAVWSWGEIADEDAVKLIVSNHLSVVILEDMEEQFMQSEDLGHQVSAGPILEHIVDNHYRLKAFLAGRERAETNEINESRKAEAEDFATRIWETIKNIAIYTGQTKQTEISDTLNMMGYLTRAGNKITQGQVSKYIKQAGKSIEWADLKKNIKNGEIISLSETDCINYLNNEISKLNPKGRATLRCYEGYITEFTAGTEITELD